MKVNNLHPTPLHFHPTCFDFVINEKYIDKVSNVDYINRNPEANPIVYLEVVVELVGKLHGRLYIPDEESYVSLGNEQELPQPRKCLFCNFYRF